MTRILHYEQYIPQSEFRLPGETRVEHTQMTKNNSSLQPISRAQDTFRQDWILLLEIMLYMAQKIPSNYQILFHPYKFLYLWVMFCFNFQPMYTQTYANE